MISVSVNSSAQDTFSILAVDTETGEVGTAGASCVDLNLIPGFNPDFFSDIVPGQGALHTQAHWNPDNQANALNQFQQGNSPQEIIDWLVANDVENNPTVRQYGVIRIENTDGSLACKLMGALQAAKAEGGDHRCAPISSIFSFVKTSKADASFNEPSFILSVQLTQNDQTDAIDSLQTLFNQNAVCDNISSTNEIKENKLVEVFPNPTDSILNINFLSPIEKEIQFELIDVTGKVVQRFSINQNQKIDISKFSSGNYFLVAKEIGFRKKITIVR
jgi:uncharacterized Ntn-hydrolase superfamily protein